MYAQFFGLKQEPFSIAPDPRYLFMSERHREALAHLLYGVKGGGGFVLLTGEIGAGKTTVCRCFLEQVPKRCNVAYIFNPKLTVFELLKTICEEFHIPVQHQGAGVPTIKDYLDPLNEFLLKTHAVGQNNLLIIDEAQNLSADVLEQLRLLTNLETSERKLLQIILIGQPELREMLARPELEQLAQRVIARYHLDALSEKETAHYIRHRLMVAGMHTALPFDGESMRRIHELSRGVPRRINLLADRALLGAYASGKGDVDRAVVDKAAAEVFDRGEERAAQRRAWRPAARVGLGLAGGAALAVLLAPGLRGAAPSGESALALGMAQAASTPAAGASSTAVPASAAQPLAAASAAPAPIAAASPAPAPAASAVDLRTALAQPLRNERQAWRELAAAWKVTLGDGEPCAAALRQGLQCFKGASSLTMIRQLDRPGFVSLRDESTPERVAYALLTGIDDLNVTLSVNGSRYTVTRAALARQWLGDFATFWRMPPGYAERGGEGGAHAGWLASQLAQAAGEPPPGEARLGESALRAKVAAFQVAQGLRPDGLAGPITLMQLNRSAGVDEPRLAAATTGSSTTER